MPVLPLAWPRRGPLAILLGAALGTLLLAGAAQAEPYDDAVDAIRRQDFAKAIELLTPLVKQGNGDAEAQLGGLYGCGCGVEKDLAREVELYRLSASHGSALGETWLGVAYERGEGVPRDMNMALSLFQRAADKGFVEAEADLCSTYLGASGAETDYAKALLWCRKAADAGDARSAFHMGIMHEKGSGVAQDLQQAVGWYRTSAERGFPIAQYKLALMLMLSDPPIWNGSQGMLWAAAAAGGGFRDANDILAMNHLEGDGVPKNLERAFYWMQESIRSGDPVGLMIMAALAERGIAAPGIPLEEAAFVAYSLAAQVGPEGRREDARATAARLLKSMPKAKAEEAQRRLAQASLGGLSDFTGDVPNRCSIPDLLFESAGQNGEQDCLRLVALGIPVGQYNLAWMAFHGAGTKLDTGRGLDLLRQAAEADYGPAQLELGKQYASGEAMAKDERQALAWLIVARDRLAASGPGPNYVEDAEQTAAALRANLTTKDIEAAQRWARDWFAGHASADGPFEQCNYLQIDAEQMKKLFDIAYDDQSRNDVLTLSTNARTIGGPCTFDFRPDYGDAAQISLSTVSEVPLHGRLERFRETGFRYLPPADYRGMDSFKLSICGTQGGRPRVCFDTSVAVEVRCVGPEECGEATEPHPSVQGVPDKDSGVKADKACSAAFDSYLSCFKGENLAKCRAKLGAKFCEEEAARAAGDLALAQSMASTLGKPPCSPQIYRMLKTNIESYKRNFGCKPR